MRGALGEARQARPFELPERRISRGERISHRGHTFFLHCGFHPDGSVREIFISARRETTDLIQMLTDNCMGLSYRMQFGTRLPALEARGDFMQVILARAIVIERECGADVMAEYAQRIAA